MRRRTSVILTLAIVAACGRDRDVAPLDRDTAVLAVPARDTVVASRVSDLLPDARTSMTGGDRDGAGGALAGAVTVADTDAALVARVAEEGIALGLADYAALAYRRYLALAPNGPRASEARMRLALLAPPPAAPDARTASRRASTHARTPAHTPARRTSSRVAEAPAVTAPSPRSASESGGDVASSQSPTTAPTAVEEPTPTAAVATTSPEVAQPAPAPRPRGSNVGRGAVVGAVSGGALGAIVGRGARGGLVGMIAGGVLGAAVGSRGSR
jgi:hypothetical protein